MMKVTMSHGILKNKSVEALDLIIQSLLTPDHELRSEAKAAGCEPELDAAREAMLQYLLNQRAEQLDPIL